MPLLATRLRPLATLTLLAGTLAQAAPPPAETSVSVLNLWSGAALMIWNEAPGSYLWAYWPFDSKQLQAQRAWRVVYLRTGSIALRNSRYGTCISSYYSSGVVHEACDADNDSRQRFDPILTRTGALLLRNAANGDCLRTYSSGAYAHAFSVDFAACPQTGSVDMQLLWILGPVLSNSERLPATE